MSSNDSLKHLNVTFEDGHVKNKNKNKNKNPVAKKAVCELEEEPIRQEPKLPVSEVGLANATARFNSYPTASCEPVHLRTVAIL